MGWSPNSTAMSGWAIAPQRKFFLLNLKIKSTFVNAKRKLLANV